MAEKLKIGLVLDTSLDPVDGVQQYVIGIGEWFRQQGHDVHYLVGESQRQDLPNVHSLSRNITVQSNGNRTTIPLPTSRRKLRKALAADTKFDVLHVQTPHSPFMAQKLVLVADRRVAIIGTFHIAAYSWLETVGTKILGWWLRPSLKHFDKIVSVSSAAADFARTTFGIETDVLPNVIDYPLFHNAKPLEEYDGAALTILFLGRLVPRKGCQLLLEAINILAQRSGLPKFRVLVCGKGPQAARLRKYINKNNLSGIVKMVGFIDEADKPRYYASADISVFPSSAGESFGIVLIEAMACGRAAVLAGDNPGYHSVMEPKPELLFDPRDAPALADKLEAYLRDAKLREDAKQWGENYTKAFDRAVVGAELLNIYRQALRKHQRA